MIASSSSILFISLWSKDLFKIFFAKFFTPLAFWRLKPQLLSDDIDSLNMLLHGSTVATNAVLEHKFSGLGLLVTSGFRDMIEIARQSVPDGYGNSFFWVKPPRLVPLNLVREIKGRLKFDGTEIDPINDEIALNSISELVDEGVNCIAV